MHSLKPSTRFRRGPLAEINVVPYIDVMLVLLVIFMVTTPLLSQGVQVNLPKASAQTMARSQEPIIVSVDKQGHFYLNTATQPETPLDESALSMELNQQWHALPKDKPSQAFVKGDAGVSYGKIIQAMVILQRAGVVNIGLLTESPPISPRT